MASIQIIKARNLGANTNQITVDGREYLQSYNTIVATYEAGAGFVLDPVWDCSRTTAKHVSQWIGIPTAEIRARVKSGQYKVTDLNGPDHVVSL